MPRPSDPRKEQALAYLRDHPDVTQTDVEAHFNLTKGILSMWLSRERRAGTPHAPPAPAVKRARNTKSNLVLLNGEPKISQPSPAPTPGVALRPIPATFLARHRALIEKQLSYMEQHETGSREYLNAHTVYRGMLADWQCIPMIDAEKGAEGLPDLSSEEGRAQVALELASLPEGVLAAAIANLKTGSP